MVLYLIIAPILSLSHLFLDFIVLLLFLMLPITIFIYLFIFFFSSKTLRAAFNVMKGVIQMKFIIIIIITTIIASIIIVITLCEFQTGWAEPL